MFELHSSFILGAGKSYLANRCKQLLEQNIAIHILSYDNHIEADSDLTAESWKKRRNRVYVKCKELVLSFKRSETAEHTQKQQVIIIDDNMFLKSMRYSYFQLAREMAVGFCQIYIQASLDTCLSRVKFRNLFLPSSSRIGESTIERMGSKFDEPDSTKNYWESNTITVSSESVDHHVLTEFLLKAKNVVPPRMEKTGKEVCGIDSFSHQADLLLRRLIKERIDEGRKNGFSVDGKRLSTVKKCLLKVFQAQSLDIVLNDVISLPNECQALLAALDCWPLQLWHPEDVCEQVVAECFYSCVQ